MGLGAKNKRSRVLAVDDSANILRVIEFVLNKVDIDVLTTDDGRKAIEIAQKEQPDLILLDFAMPGFNGYEVCEALADSPSSCDIPIVMMSTKGDRLSERFVREMGIIDHVTKPFSPEILQAVVQHRLDVADDDAAVGMLAQSAGSEEPLSVLMADVLGWEQKTSALFFEKLRAAPKLAERLRRWLLEVDGAPALQGELNAIPIAEVFQLMAMQRQTGWLHVSRGIQRISVAFLGGRVRLVTARSAGDEFLLGTIMVREKMIEQSDLDLFLQNREGTRRRLGQQAVALGYVNSEQLGRALFRQSTELTYELLRWGTGYFEFQPLELLPDWVGDVGFDFGVDELLMEGFRRVDEWGLIENEIPSFACVPRVRGVEKDTENELSEEEKNVFELIDGRRSVDEIVREAGFGTFEVARLIYRLAASKRIEIE